MIHDEDDTLSFRAWEHIAQEDLRRALDSNSQQALKIHKLISKLSLMGFTDIQYNNFGLACRKNDLYKIYKIDKNGNIDEEILELNATDCRVIRHFIIATNMVTDEQYIYIKDSFDNILERFPHDERYVMGADPALYRVIKAYSGESEVAIGHNGKILNPHTYESLDIHKYPNDESLSEASNEYYRITATNRIGHVRDLYIVNGNLKEISAKEIKRIEGKLWQV